MSALEVSKSFAVPDLDMRILRGLVERLGTAQEAATRHITALAQARADYDEYVLRLAPDIDIAEYQVNFLTKQIEAIPPKPEVKPVRAPDADLPPAPFREADVVAR